MKRLISAILSAVLTVALLASCASTPKMTFSFVEEVLYETYTNKVEGSAMTIYVDASAADGGNGSEKAPFKTIPEAQAKIRELKAGEGLPTGGITVLVKDGEYRLSESLVFTEEDSGTAECPITYVSESEFGAILTGGLILSAKDFEPISQEEKDRLIDETAKEKVVKVDLTEYGLTEADWGKLYPYGAYILNSQYDDGVGPASSELFIDGKRQTIARYPNEGFVYTKKMIDTGIAIEYFSDTNFDKRGNSTSKPENANIRNPQGGIFTVDESVRERLAQWSSLEDIWTFGYYKWSWADAAPRIAKIDVNSGMIWLEHAVVFGVSSNAPFYFFNIFDELDTEGEFYIDRTNGILYLYRTEDFDSAEIMMSCSLKDIIVATDVSYLTIKGFSACATRANGFVMSGNDFVVDNCLIYNIRGNALSANGTNITIQNCEIRNIGSSCISVVGGDNATLTKSNNLVYNNYIHDWSEVDRTYRTAVSIGGCGNTVSHNEIANAPHMAVGWSGAYQTIEYNDIYNVCFETADCGALYAGRNYDSYGCIIRYNYIHDIGNAKGDAHAIYWDDGLGGQTAYGNIIVNIGGYAFQLGGGRDNIIENNVIINSTKNLHYDDRMRAGLLDGGWFGDSLTINMSNQVVNYSQNEKWVEAFPTYGDIIPYTGEITCDPDDKNFIINPYNSAIRNNITYCVSDYTVGLDYDSSRFYIEEGAAKYLEVENNIFFYNDRSDFPGWHNGDYTMIANSKAKELCPDFEPIPFDKIGRID